MRLVHILVVLGILVLAIAPAASASSLTDFLKGITANAINLGFLKGTPAPAPTTTTTPAPAPTTTTTPAPKTTVAPTPTAATAPTPAMPARATTPVRTAANEYDMVAGTRIPIADGEITIASVNTAARTAVATVRREIPISDNAVITIGGVEYRVRIDTTARKVLLFRTASTPATSAPPAQETEQQPPAKATGVLGRLGKGLGLFG